ncbi:MAG TPA: hypothetical protein VGD80_01050, partial [Kofleriaceae bacterium]
ADALARHSAADVTALRARRDDSGARCALGAIYARRNDLSRASLYLTDCADAALPDDIAATVRAAVRDVKRRLDASRYSALDVLSRPEGLTAETDALPGESFTTPATIWIPPGDHQLRATLAERSWTLRVTTEPHKNASILIETGRSSKPAPTRTAASDGAVDEPGGALGEQLSAPPPDIKHPSLLSDKYRGVARASTGATPGATLDDPLAPRADATLDDPLAARTASRPERSLWLGARLGIGMFDDAATSPRAGFAIAAASRFRITDTAFLAARADWTRRGGSAISGMSGTVDALGASAGLGVTVLGHSRSARAPRQLALALITQLRADVRLTDHRDDAAVHRAGLGLAASAELALPSTPFTLGVRFEQGLTDLVPGARDRAVLAEVGIDLR